MLMLEVKRNKKKVYREGEIILGWKKLECRKEEKHQEQKIISAFNCYVKNVEKLLSKRVASNIQ